MGKHSKMVNINRMIARSIEHEKELCRKNPKRAIGKMLLLTPFGNANPFEIQRWVEGKPSILDDEKTVTQTPESESD